MSFEVHALPILEDNFVYVGVREAHAFAVDPGEPRALLKFLTERELQLDAVLITHEHADHIDGLLEICLQMEAPVYYSKKCQKVPSILQEAGLDSSKQFAVGEGEHFEVLGCKVMVLSGAGHTEEQILFHFPIQHKLFSGDLIFHLGCGRIFKGTITQHFNSLQSLGRLPYATLIYPTHDYSNSNLAFCKAHNLIGDQVYPLLNKIPIPLNIEMKWNPFLRAENEIEFSKIRMERNNFKYSK